MSHKIRVVMLCGNWQTSRIMYHGIASLVDVVGIIVEKKPSASKLIQRRIITIGIARTVGQLLFLVINKLMAKSAQARITQLLRRLGLVDTPFPANITHHVDSVNSRQTIALLQELKPDAVVVNGTRIIATNVLSSIGSPFINTHMGITPRYRGSHGGYWALASDDSENCGVTIHLVDEGIDTGGVLYQDRIHPDHDDNINTYPIHQIAQAIPLMRAALEDVKEKKLAIKPGVSPSRLWYHPSLFEYAKYWLLKGVR